jgi:hypothetical protein
MKVDFNNLRVMALRNHDNLVDILNEHIDKETETVTVPVGYIEKTLEALRQHIGSIAMVYDEAQGGEFKDVFSEHYPGDTGMKVFNPEDGE